MYMFVYMCMQVHMQGYDSCPQKKKNACYNGTQDSGLTQSFF